MNTYGYEIAKPVIPQISREQFASRVFVAVHRRSPVAQASGGYALVTGRGLLIAVASHCVEPGL